MWLQGLREPGSARGCGAEDEGMGVGGGEGRGREGVGHTHPGVCMATVPGILWLLGHFAHERFQDEEKFKVK